MIYFFCAKSTIVCICLSLVSPLVTCVATRGFTVLTGGGSLAVL